MARSCRVSPGRRATARLLPMAAATLLLALAGAWGTGSTVSLRAQSSAPGFTFTGRNSCGGSECHAKFELDWLTTKPGGKEHAASLNTLNKSPDTSGKYAKAVGLADYLDPAGMCVKCHGTYLARAKTREGVGCEGCHGPASGYREFHSQSPKDRAGAVSRGLRNVFDQPAVWIKICRDCHVLDGRAEYKDLIDEGHKDGARWNVARKFVNVQAHWKRVTYTDTVIAAAGAGKPIVVTTNPAPAAEPSTPAPPPPAPPSGVRPPAATGTPLPVSPGVSTGAPARTPSGGAPVKPSAPVGNAPTAAMPPPGVSTPAPLPQPPGPSLPVVASPLALDPPPATTAAGLIAALQDGVAGLLESLLRKNDSPPARLEPPAPPAATGPGAEFLQLQYEALRLAVEALNLRVKPGAEVKK